MKGDNKTHFEKWYINDYIMRKENIGLHVFGTKVFDKTPIEYKIGVYLAYYDSVGIFITIGKYVNPNEFNFSLFADKEINSLFFQGVFNSRNEAYKEAFNQADEIVNKQLNKHESN
jgi:hypothetical protein